MLLLVPAAAFAQSAPATPSPAPTAVATAAATAAPNPIGPALFPNDPCTSLSAIITRPSVDNSVCTVRPNHVAIETGYQNVSSNGVGNTVTYPQTLIAIGTKIPGLELDITPPQFERVTAAGTYLSGTTDAGVGLKAVFAASGKAQLGGLISFSAPTGSSGISAGGTESDYSLQGSLALSPALSITSTMQLQSLTNGNQRWSSFVPAAVLSLSLPQATSVFAEAATFSNAVGPQSATRTQYLVGIQHDIGALTQLDFSYGYSPTIATGRYHSIGFGVSRYF
jgi:hypothetical protein